MEYSELEKLWIQYDNKLNHLETLNKRLILETLSKKSQKKINWLQFRNYYGLIVVPAMMLYVLYPYLEKGGLDDAKFVTGVILLLGFIVYSIWFLIMGISKLKKIDFINNTVVELATQINDYKRMVISRFKSLFITLPVSLAGILLIAWDVFTFDQNQVLFIAGLSLFIILWAKRQHQGLKKRIDKLLNEVNELKEYKE